MKAILKTITLPVAIITLMACSDTGPAKKVTDGISKTQPVLRTIQADSVTGNYVDADYALRSKGYDWIAVLVEKGPDKSIRIRVRSRADKKKPTCTLDAVAYLVRENLYRSELKQGNILFAFSGSSLAISPESSRDEAALYFYCSGGGNLKGTYDKVYGTVDTAGNFRRQAIPEI